MRKHCSVKTDIKQTVGTMEQLRTVIKYRKVCVCVCVCVSVGETKREREVGGWMNDKEFKLY